jgi:hypothetical protein
MRRLRGSGNTATEMTVLVMQGPHDGSRRTTRHVA